ncbi:MAG: ABC transporter ATP-binding protein [Opitutales bacterium]|nr:ABC transporter ATP-binding protein [Opitutales bacterium]
MPLLEVNKLSISFRGAKGPVQAVHGLSFSLDKGRTLGIVGESGSGKTLSCSALTGLMPRKAFVSSGSARFDGMELLHADEKQLRGIRGQRIGMVFQDPMSALNPFMRVSAQLCEALCLHKGMKRRDALDMAVAELEAVGLPDASTRINQYPHQFSGGQRQRILIAMALLQRPELLIADEPTTALDVTLQAQILELIKARQKELGTAVIIITHNLGVAATLCDEVLVMYAGRVMEYGSAVDVLNNPAHPYTSALKRSIPGNSATLELPSIPGTPPAAGEYFSGCPFAPRCEYARDICTSSPPELLQKGSAQLCACTLVHKGELPR